MTETLPLLCICVPTYNRSTYLRKFLSVIIPEIAKYKLENEVVIFIGDNNSTDDTALMIEGFKNNSTAKILYHKNESNIGAVNNIIRLLENSNSKFLTIFGDDDEMVVGSLPQVISVVKENPEILVHHFKCRQTNFIKAGMTHQKLTVLDAAEKYFYNLGNAGTFIFNTEKAKAIVASKKDRLACTCWPQTEIMFLMLMVEKESKRFAVSGIELVSSGSHDGNVIYNTWYILETFCFSLLRVAQNIEADHPNTGIMKSARKAIPACMQAVKYFFRFILFATYYDYGYELEKTKKLITQNKQYLKGGNVFYPTVYSVLLSLPRCVKKLLTAFYFFVSKPTFKKSIFEKNYDTVKLYQQKKLEVYTQKGKLTEDTERYIY